MATKCERRCSGRMQVGFLRTRQMLGGGALTTGCPTSQVSFPSLDRLIGSCSPASIISCPTSTSSPRIKPNTVNNYKIREYRPYFTPPHSHRIAAPHHHQLCHSAESVPRTKVSMRPGPQLSTAGCEVATPLIDSQAFHRVPSNWRCHCNDLSQFCLPCAFGSAASRAPRAVGLPRQLRGIRIDTYEGAVSSDAIDVQMAGSVRDGDRSVTKGAPE